MDKNYWEKYYAEVDGVIQPSTFAQYAMTRFPKGCAIVELGCGNGRDSLFFANNGFTVYALDQCASAIARLEGKSTLLTPKVSNVASPDIDLPEGRKAIYNRFLLHALDRAEANGMLEWVGKNLDSNDLFFCECRSVKSDLYGKGDQREDDVFYTGKHHRRFIRKEELIQELEQNGLEILELVEEAGIAVHRDDDPVVIRVIAQKT